jgi:hypothetical protein
MSWMSNNQNLGTGRSVLPTVATTIIGGGARDPPKEDIVMRGITVTTQQIQEVEFDRGSNDSIATKEQRTFPPRDNSTDAVLGV